MKILCRIFDHAWEDIWEWTSDLKMRVRTDSVECQRCHDVKKAEGITEAIRLILE